MPYSGAPLSPLPPPPASPAPRPPPPQPSPLANPLPTPPPAPPANPNPSPPSAPPVVAPAADHISAAPPPLPPIRLARAPAAARNPGQVLPPAATAPEAAPQVLRLPGPPELGLTGTSQMAGGPSAPSLGDAVRSFPPDAGGVAEPSGRASPQRLAGVPAAFHGGPVVSAASVDGEGGDGSPARAPARALAAPANAAGAAPVSAAVAPTPSLAAGAGAPSAARSRPGETEIQSEPAQPTPARSSWNRSRTGCPG